jgi:RNA polymerase sigma-B factor
VPRDLQERVLAMNRETETLAKTLGRSPSPREVARELGWSIEELLEVREAANAYAADSLDASVEDAHSGTGMTVVETLGSEDARYDLVDPRDALASAWRTLPERERRVLGLRFGDDLTQSEIGERIGASRRCTSRACSDRRSSACGRPPEGCRLKVSRATGPCFAPRSTGEPFPRCARSAGCHDGAGGGRMT